MGIIRPRCYTWSVPAKLPIEPSAPIDAQILPVEEHFLSSSIRQAQLAKPADGPPLTAA